MTPALMLAAILSAAPVSKVVVVDVERIEASLEIADSTAPGDAKRWEQQAKMLEALPGLIAQVAKSAGAEMAITPAAAQRIAIEPADLTAKVEAALRQQFPDEAP